MQDLVIYATEIHMHGYQPKTQNQTSVINDQVIKGFFSFHLLLSSRVPLAYRFEGLSMHR